MNIVEVEHLKVWDTNTGKVIIHNSSFEVKQGSCMAIVGESGSGKSVTCRAIMRLNKPWIRQSGTMLFQGEDLNQLSEPEMRRKRGKHYV